jgi:hypothetical protein
MTDHAVNAAVLRTVLERDAARAELAHYKAAAKQILAWCDAAEHPEWDVSADLPSVHTAILRGCLAAALSGEDQ